jgi:hypothetical protein
MDYSATGAVIYLKNGKRKHGMLIDLIVDDVYHFISNANFLLFQKTNNPDFIEKLSVGSIEAIDVDIK